MLFIIYLHVGRLNHFEDNWIKLEKWFTRYASLDIVNATGNKEQVYDEVEALIEKKIKMVSFFI